MLNELTMEEYCIMCSGYIDSESNVILNILTSDYYINSECCNYKFHKDCYLTHVDDHGVCPQCHTIRTNNTCFYKLFHWFVFWSLLTKSSFIGLVYVISNYETSVNRYLVVPLTIAFSITFAATLAIFNNVRKRIIM